MPRINEEISDPEQAGPELERRLAQKVRVDGGLILIDGPLGSFVLPASTPWTLQCFGGMSIIFGNSVTNDIIARRFERRFPLDTSNDVVVYLSVGSISPENCKILAPRIGKRLLMMLR